MRRRYAKTLNKRLSPSSAQRICRECIIDGLLIPEKSCQICAKPEGFQEYSFSKPATIIPHHFRGYDFPLDVWWVCRSCNRRLINKHDDSLTIEEARKYLFGDMQRIANALKYDRVLQIKQEKRFLSSRLKALNSLNKEIRKPSEIRQISLFNN